MFTMYEKVIVGFNCVFLTIGVLNLSINIKNMLANKRVETNTKELKNSVEGKQYPRS